MKVDTLNLENETDNLALTQSKLALNLKGLDLEGYQALQASSGQGVEEKRSSRRWTRCSSVAPRWSWWT